MSWMAGSRPFEGRPTAAAGTGELPVLRRVSTAEELSRPIVPLAAEPVWLDLELQPEASHRVRFRYEAAEPMKIVVLFKIDEDTQQPRNEWGIYNSQWGRFRYLQLERRYGVAFFNLRAPRSGRVRLGIGLGRHVANASISDTVAVAPTGDLGSSWADDEVHLLRQLVSSCRQFLEFGSGGSTLMAAESPAERCVSVEADMAWVARMRGIDAIRQAEATGKLTFHHADIGPTGRFSFPLDQSRSADWPSYYLGVWRYFASPPDLVLVDARFRVACCAVAMLACPPQTTFVLHDYGTTHPDRQVYTRINEVADLHQLQSRLAVFRKKRNFDSLKALSLLEDVRLNYW